MVPGPLRVYETACPTSRHREVVLVLDQDDRGAFRINGHKSLLPENQMRLDSTRMARGPGAAVQELAGPVVPAGGGW